MFEQLIRDQTQLANVICHPIFAGAEFKFGVCVCVCEQSEGADCGMYMCADKVLGVSYMW